LRIAVGHRGQLTPHHRQAGDAGVDLGPLRSGQGLDFVRGQGRHVGIGQQQADLMSGMPEA